MHIFSCMHIFFCIQLFFHRRFLWLAFSPLPKVLHIHGKRLPLRPAAHENTSIFAAQKNPVHLKKTEWWCRYMHYFHCCGKISSTIADVHFSDQTSLHPITLFAKQINPAVRLRSIDTTQMDFKPALFSPQLDPGKSCIACLFCIFIPIYICNKPFHSCHRQSLISVFVFFYLYSVFL